jgi:mRNA interferase RelE/StbE
MNYNIFILRRAQKELAQLPDAAYERAKIAIRKLAENPRPRGCRKLSGRDGWRIRVGDYRVTYETKLSLDNSPAGSARGAGWRGDWDGCSRARPI